MKIILRLLGLCPVLVFPVLASAQVVIPGAGGQAGFPRLTGYSPTQETAAAAFSGLLRWLATDEGKNAVALNPALAGFQKIDIQTQSGQAALEPLAQALGAEIVAQLALIETLPSSERDALLSRIAASVPAAAQAEARTNRSLALAKAAAWRWMARTEDSSQWDLPIDTFKLENGLTVVVQPDHASPTVGVSITYRVGSQDEQPGRSGFAHLFEHLMAQGTKNLKPRELSQLIEGNGGMRNASTNKTGTTYQSLVPKNALEMVLWAEADRMSTLDVNARALALEQQVVMEEMRRSYLNQPYRTAVSGGMGQAAWTKWENQHTTIGEMEDVLNANLADVRAFYKAHYAPNNAVLALTGDVTLDEARQLASSYFGALAPREIAPTPDLSEPAMTVEKRLTVKDPIAKQPMLMVGYRAPERGTKDFWALSLLDQIFSGSDTNPLYQALVKSAKAAVSAGSNFPWWTSHHTMKGPDLFGFSATLKLGFAADEALALVDQVVARYAQAGPSPEELEQAKAQTELQWIDGLQFLWDRAKFLSTYAALIGDPNNFKKDLEAVRAITAEDVRAAAARWLTGKGRAIVNVEPAASGAARPDFKTPEIPAETPRQPEEAPPTPGPLKPAEVPELHRFTLRNGLKVVVVEKTGLPMIEARLSMRAGRASEEEGENGLSKAAASLMLKGTSDQDGAATLRALKKIGYSLSIDSGKDSMSLSASGLSRTSTEFFAQLGKILSQASYPAEELALWKQRTAQNLKDLYVDPEFMTGEQLKKELFEGHPYGKPYIDGESLSLISRERLLAFHRRVIAPQGATLVVVGDIDPQEAQKTLEASLAAWAGKSAEPEIPVLPAPKPSRLVIVNRENSKQANLTVAQTLDLSPRDPDYIAFKVMNHILGGTSTSRLFLNLRVAHGYTYGAYAQIELLKQGILWEVQAETRNEVAAPSFYEIMKEVNGMRDELVPETTLSAMKRNLAGLFAIQLSAMNRIAGKISAQEELGLDPAEDMRNYLSRLDAVTAEDVQRVARKYLDPKKMIAVAVGDEKFLGPALVGFKPDSDRN